MFDRNRLVLSAQKCNSKKRENSLRNVGVFQKVEDIYFPLILYYALSE